MNARKKLSLLEFAQRFSSEDKARTWFQRLIWSDGERDCPSCGSLDTHQASHPKMLYRCQDCRRYFSVKTGTVTMEVLQHNDTEAVQAFTARASASIGNRVYHENRRAQEG